MDRVISSKQPSPFLKRLLEIKRLRQENPMIINCVLLSLGSYIFQSSISWSHSFKRVIIGKALWEEIKKRASFMLPINSIQEEATEERR